jgi:hypothetical protein
LFLSFLVLQDKVEEEVEIEPTPVAPAILDEAPQDNEV